MRGWMMVVATAGLVAGCDDDWQQLQGAPEEVVDVPLPGIYEGTMEVEVRAYGGPIRVAREQCSVRFEGVVDPTRQGWFTAEGANCYLGSRAGDVDFAFWLGDETPYQGAIGGPLDGMEGDWAGWFHHEDELYVESAGEVFDRGGRAAFVVFVDAVRVGDVDDAGLTGSAPAID